MVYNSLVFGFPSLTYFIKFTPKFNYPMEPKAVLVLYEPGCKLKHSNYLLSLGANIVGTDPKCQVILSSKSYFPQEYVANFYITEDFMYIEALCDNMVQFKSNMVVQSSGRKKDVFRHIEKSCRYLVPMEEIFYIGPYKAIVQVQKAEDLRRVGNVRNLENFETPKGEFDDEEKHERYMENNVIRSQGQNIHSISQNDFSQTKSDHTQKIQSDNDAFQPTLVIQQNDPYVYQPTLALDDDIYGQEKRQTQNNSHTLQVDTVSMKCRSPMLLSPQRSPMRVSQRSSEQSRTMTRQKGNQSQQSELAMFTRQKHELSIVSRQRPQKLSQQQLYQSIKRQQLQLRRQLHNINADDISMPDTVKDDDQQLNAQTQQLQIQMPAFIPQADDIMPPTIKQNQQDLMPATIRQDQQFDRLSNIQMPATIKESPESVEEKRSKPVLHKITKSLFEKKPQGRGMRGMQLYKSEKFQMADEDEEEDDLIRMFEKGGIRQVESDQLEMEQKVECKRDEGKKKSLFNFQLSYCANTNIIQAATQNLQKTDNNLNKSTVSSLNNSKKTIPPQNPSTNPPPSQNPLFTSPLQQKPPPPSTSPLNRRRLFNQPIKPKLVNLTSFKPKTQDKITLSRRNYQIVPQGKTQDYDLLIVGKNVERASDKLLMAILVNRPMVTEDWLKEKEWEDVGGWKMVGMVEGISWEGIDRVKDRKRLFDGAGVFFFSDNVQEYKRVFEVAGGMITVELNKRKKTNIIINCEANQDKQLFQKNKTSKNWKFYSHRVIAQSILLSQPQFKKYLVDQTSF